jgi:hypothetical protein
VVLEASRALPLEAALRVVAQAAGVDLLVGAVPQVEVRGRISGPFREVLDTLVRVYGGGQVGYTLVGKTVVVGPKDALLPSGGTPSAAPSLRYLGYARSGERALGVVEFGGRTYVLSQGDVVPGTSYRVVQLSPASLVLSWGDRRFTYAMDAFGGQQGGDGR